MPTAPIGSSASRRTTSPLPVRTALPRAGRGREHGAARTRRVAVHERAAAHLGHRCSVRRERAGLNLPIDPNGVVYNSVSRTPVAGATLTLLNAGSGAPLPDGCFYDAAQQGQVTLADGYYKFDVNFSDAACPSGGDYLVGVTCPPEPFTSRATRRSSRRRPTRRPRLSRCRPARPSADDAIPGTALFCEVQGSEFAPAASVPARSAGTIYHVHLRWTTASCRARARSSTTTSRSTRT